MYGTIGPGKFVGFQKVFHVDNLQNITGEMNFDKN